MCSKQHFGIKYIFQTRSSSYRFWTVSKTYSYFWLGIFAPYFHNCNYVSIATSSSKTFFSKKVFFPNLLPFLRGVFSNFGPKINGRVDKSALFVSEGHFMEKKHFFLKKNKTYLTFTDFERIAFEIWHEASTELPNFHILS